MLYGLRSVSDHPVYRLHAAFGFFLNDGLKLATFGMKCFPDWLVPVIKASPGLRSRCEAVHAESRKQSQAVRDRISCAWSCHCNVQKLCESSQCVLENWGFNHPKLIRCISDLFDFLYEQTLESKALEKAIGKGLADHYNEFRELGQRVCPFCGLNYYADRDDSMRSAYDHYLARAHYPLASINFLNLVPMCDDCNRPPRKGAKDVLFSDKARKTRRTFYYPYSKASGIILSVACVARPKPSAPLGSWRVQADAVASIERPKVDAWKTVFGVEGRFAARVREGLDGWMKDFLSSKGYTNNPTVNQLRKDLAEKSAWLSRPEQVKSRIEALLQAAAFSFMAKDAPHEMIAGYAALATSGATAGIPTALG